MARNRYRYDPDMPPETDFEIADRQQLDGPSARFQNAFSVNSDYASRKNAHIEQIRAQRSMVEPTEIYKVNKAIPTANDYAQYVSSHPLNTGEPDSLTRMRETWRQENERWERSENAKKVAGQFEGTGYSYGTITEPAVRQGSFAAENQDIINKISEWNPPVLQPASTGAEAAQPAGKPAEGAAAVQQDGEQNSELKNWLIENKKKYFELAAPNQKNPFSAINQPERMTNSELERLVKANADLRDMAVSQGVKFGLPSLKAGVLRGEEREIPYPVYDKKTGRQIGTTTLGKAEDALIQQFNDAANINDTVGMASAQSQLGEIWKERTKGLQAAQATASLGKGKELADQISFGDTLTASKAAKEAAIKILGDKKSAGLLYNPRVQDASVDVASTAYDIYELVKSGEASALKLYTTVPTLAKRVTDLLLDKIAQTDTPDLEVLKSDAISEVLKQSKRDKIIQIFGKEAAEELVRDVDAEVNKEFAKRYGEAEGKIDAVRAEEKLPLINKFRSIAASDQGWVAPKEGLKGTAEAEYERIMNTTLRNPLSIIDLGNDDNDMIDNPAELGLAWFAEKLGDQAIPMLKQIAEGSAPPEMSELQNDFNRISERLWNEGAIQSQAKSAAVAANNLATAIKASPAIGVMYEMGRSGRLEGTNVAFIPTRPDDNLFVHKGHAIPVANAAIKETLALTPDELKQTVMDAYGYGSGDLTNVVGADLPPPISSTINSIVLGNTQGDFDGKPFQVLGAGIGNILNKAYAETKDALKGPGVDVYKDELNAQFRVVVPKEFEKAFDAAEDLADQYRIGVVKMVNGSDPKGIQAKMAILNLQRRSIVQLRAATEELVNDNAAVNFAYQESMNDDEQKEQLISNLPAVKAKLDAAKKFARDVAPVINADATPPELVDVEKDIVAAEKLLGLDRESIRQKEEERIALGEKPYIGTRDFHIEIRDIFGPLGYSDRDIDTIVRFMLTPYQMAKLPVDVLGGLANSIVEAFTPPVQAK